jgi:hypothetical protein
MIQLVHAQVHHIHVYRLHLNQTAAQLDVPGLIQTVQLSRPATLCQVVGNAINAPAAHIPFLAQEPLTVLFIILTGQIAWIVIGVNGLMQSVVEHPVHAHHILLSLIVNLLAVLGFLMHHQYQHLFFRLLRQKAQILLTAAQL